MQNASKNKRITHNPFSEFPFPSILIGEKTHELIKIIVKYLIIESNRLGLLYCIEQKPHRNQSRVCMHTQLVKHKHRGSNESVKR